MPPTFWVEIEMEGGMGCYRGMTGGELKRLWMIDGINFEANSEKRGWEGIVWYDDILSGLCMLI